MAGKAAARDLSYFVLRSQALSQYRRAVRCVRQAPADVRGALLSLAPCCGHLTRCCVLVRAWFGVQRS